MSHTPQTYATHRRLFPLFHYIALPGLVERCLRGELATTDAVKRAVQDWRADYIRA